MPITSHSHLMNFKSTIDAEGGPISPARYIFALGGYPRVLVNQQKYQAKGMPFIKSLRYLCDSADLPGITIHTNQRSGYSPDMMTQMPGMIEYGSLNVSVICRDYMSEKEYFDDWMLSVKNGHRGGVGATFDNAYMNDFVVDAQLYVMSHYNPGNGQENDVDEILQIRYAINLINLYPTNMDSVALSWEGEGSMKLNIAFAYARWEPIIGASLYAHSFPAESRATAPVRQLLNYAQPRG